jgi:hypothetical protein
MHQILASSLASRVANRISSTYLMTNMNTHPSHHQVIRGAYDSETFKGSVAAEMSIPIACKVFIYSMPWMSSKLS